MPPAKNAKKVRILVLDGDARQALPFYKSWRRAGHHITILSYTRLSPGRLSRYVHKRLIVPDCEHDEQAFHAAVMKVIKTRRYDVVFPFGHYTMYYCARHRSELEKFAIVPLAENKTFMRAFDKAQTMAFCMENDIPCPYTYLPAKEEIEAIIKRCSFPLWLKPTISVGAIGGRRIDTPDGIRQYVPPFTERYGEMILQEFIPQDDAEQLVCHVFMDAKAKICACMVSLKPRYFPPRGGTSTALVSVDRTDVAEYCTKMFEGMGLSGIADADIIVDPRDGQPKVMEINPRVSCSIKTGFAAGIDYADMWMRLAMGEPIEPKLDYPKGIVLRNLCQDILWYLFTSSQERKGASPPFFDFFGPKVLYQTISADDPLTFFGFVLGMLKKYSSAEVRAEKLGKCAG